jgi:GT2 family glycosyltransferase/2-polyprenyl-3-methyl-5-hydroxy-6-metoxy-1,4-benzoquinol methylase
MKYNFRVDMTSDNTHSLILRNVRPGTRVLEFGPATGYMTQYMKDTLGCEVTCVELDPEGAERARLFAGKVVVGDLDDLEWITELEPRYFDHILCADVLEHLKDPWEVLKAAVAFLKDDGTVITSIPNVGHVGLILDLIEGNFTYRSLGLLDNTHLRFFTRKSIEDLLEQCSLTPTQVLCTSFRPEQTEFKKRLEDYPKPIVDFLSSKPDSFVYQYIHLSQKREFLSRSDIAEASSSAIGKNSLVSSSPPIQVGLVSTVILTFNQLKYTKECIESIQKNTPERHEIIFVDNGSTDGTCKWLRQLVKEHNNYRLIENQENVGFAKGCNQGIKASSGEYVLLLNNDVVVTEGWLAGLIDCLRNTSDAGIIGPMTNNISGPQRVEDPHYTREDLDRYAGAFRRNNRHRRVPARRIVGFCMLFRRDLADTIGLLDEHFGTGNFEDDDFCLRAALLGYHNRMAGDVFIHHYGSRSFIGNRIDYAAAMTGNRSVFDAKWSGIDVKTPLGIKIRLLRAFEAADECHHKGETDRAVEALINAITYAPDEPEIYRRLAGMLINAKNVKGAYEALHSMPEQRQDELQSLVLLGICYEGLSDYEKAEQCAARALSLNPDFAPALNLKGMVACGANNPDKAVDLFNKAIAADPGYGEPHTNLGVLKWAAGEKDEALELLERGFILDPTGSEIASLYHSAVTSAGCFARAERPFLEAKGLYPHNKRLVLLLTDILIQQGRFPDAMREIEYSLSTFGLDDGLLSAALEIRNKVGPPESDDPSKKVPLSLCMIVKNEEQNLVRCLTSVKPIVDEIIVVDTGSTDRTKDIAKAFGARVFDFEWTDSFAEARNVSLSKARGHWILILDADEVISRLDYGRLREIVRKKGHSRPVAHLITTRNYVARQNITGWTANDGRYGTDEFGTGWVPSKKVRLFPNDRRIRFENPVHELVQPSLNRLGIKTIECSIPVHHYGKLDENKVKAKGQEYYLLGKRKLEEKSGDAQSLFELALQAGEIGEFTEAIELWQKLLSRDSSLPQEVLLQAYLNIGRSYIELGNHDEAFRVSKKVIETDSNSKEAILNYTFCEFWVGDPQKAIPPLKKLMEKEPSYPPALGLLSAVYLVCGRKETALEHLGTLEKMGFNSATCLFDHANRLTTAGQFQRAAILLEAAIAINNIAENTHMLLSECYSNLNREPTSDAQPGSVQEVCQ